MVKKLFKHEYLAWLRVLPVLYIITFGVAAMHRLIQLFENDSVYYNIISGSAIFMYVVMLMVCLAAPTVFSIARFYKNMFTGEGYLTLTLPVKPSDHLWVKALTVVSFDILSLLACFISFMIISAGDVFSEVCKAAWYLLEAVFEKLGGHFVAYGAEVCLLLLVASFLSCLLYYTCICIGQLFRKNRILAAVGVYFGFYLVTQVFSTVLGIVIVILESAGAFAAVEAFADAHPYAFLHILLCGSAALYAALATVYFVICHHIIRKKLNLE